MKYFVAPKNYKLLNPRLDGFRKLDQVGAPIFDIFVTTPACEKEFLKTKKFSKAFEKEAVAVFKTLKKKWPKSNFAVRRAYVVPGIENPPGPRFNAAATKEEILTAFKGIFDFALTQKYDQVKGSQIAAFIHPWIGPEKFDVKKPSSGPISYGGYAISQSASKTVEIYAVYGMNEGVQTLVADRYVVQTQGSRALIVRKEVPQKNKMLCPTPTSQAELVNVPLELQFEQVFFDNEILEIAKYVQMVSEKFGPQRVEFMVNSLGLFFIEAADYWKETAGENNVFEAEGEIVIVSNPADLAKIKEVPAKDLEAGKKVVFVDEQVVMERNYDVLGALAAWGNNLVVLYPGVAATQHAMRILADKGHRAFLVGTQRFAEKDKVKIMANGEKVRITNLTRIESQELVSLWDASLFDVQLCGGKAFRLSKLKVAGFQVPHGCVITTLVFDDLLRSLQLSFPVPSAMFPAVYDRMKNPPNQWLAKIATSIGDYVNSQETFSVRSSATVEDSASHSMAGMFESYLNLAGKDLTENVGKVFKSTFSSRVADYLTHHSELVSNLKMAVVIEQMVDARVAGVIFGADIRTRDANIVEIEAGKGLGESIVSGEATEVEKVRFSRSDRKLLSRSGSQLLSPTEYMALFMLSERLRKEFDEIPQDIEWAIDKSGQIWVLQSRNLIY